MYNMEEIIKKKYKIINRESNLGGSKAKRGGLGVRLLSVL